MSGFNLHRGPAEMLSKSFGSFSDDHIRRHETSVYPDIDDADLDHSVNIVSDSS